MLPAGAPASGSTSTADARDVDAAAACSWIEVVSDACALLSERPALANGAAPPARSADAETDAVGEACSAMPVVMAADALDCDVAAACSLIPVLSVACDWLALLPPANRSEPVTITAEADELAEADACSGIAVVSEA